MRKIAYLAIDVHANRSVLGDMDDDGRFRGNQSFATSENNIIRAIEAVKAKNKYLVIEEGTLAYWAAQVGRPCVTEVIICDPGQNALICLRGEQKLICSLGITTRSRRISINSRLGQ